MTAFRWHLWSLVLDILELWLSAHYVCLSDDSSPHMLIYHTDSACTYSLDYMVVSNHAVFLLDLRLISYQMFISALLAFILYLLVFLKLRGIVRAQAFSTSVAAAAKERDEKYEHKLARQMLLYPVGIQSAGPFALILTRAS
jgi:hypothetical protein